jgi:hypothetical protein
MPVGLPTEMGAVNATSDIAGQASTRGGVRNTRRAVCPDEDAQRISRSAQSGDPEMCEGGLSDACPQVGSGPPCPLGSGQVIDTRTRDADERDHAKQVSDD